MKANSSEAKGAAGHNEVKSAFNRIGWAPVDNLERDQGTDIWVRAFDERGHDLCQIIGAQIKSGASYFERPEYEDEKLIGFWLPEEQSHFDYWLSFTIAHLVVLHDLDTRVSYWVQVTPETVVDTGKNSKILVPVENVIDEANLERLIEVAGSTPNGWEGSAWTAGSAIAPADRLRHSLMVPRLMAPHPNAGFPKAPSAEQAIAMLMQTRIRELDECAKKFDEVPKLDEANDSSDWLWQFYGALWKRVVGDGENLLLERAKDAPSPDAHASAVVAAASALTETGQAQDAIALLTEAIELDECEPVDHAWLLVQRARARVDIGQIADAHVDAISAQGASSRAPMDATAGAISASAAVLLFNTADHEKRDIENAIVRSDTAATWWQAQVTSRALGAALERSFKQWAADRSVTLGADDIVHDKLAAASLTSSHEGDQGAWADHAGRQAIASLIGMAPSANPEGAAACLRTLRMTGSEKWMTLAVRRLSVDGPAKAVALAAREVNLSESTRTTGYTDLKFIKAAGDLMEGEVATSTAASILKILDEPDEFAARCRPEYLLDLTLLEALTGVVGAADESIQREIAQRIIACEPQGNQIYAQAWARLADALPLRAFPAEDAAALVDRAKLHHYPLPHKMLGLATRLGDDEARNALSAEAQDGSLNAMMELGDVTTVGPEIAAAEIARLAGRVQDLVVEARRRNFGMTAVDLGHALTLLNLEHPEHANWDPIVELIRDDAVAAGQKAETIQALAGFPEKIPEDVRQPLAEAVLRIARNEGNITTMLFDRRDDVSAVAVHLALALDAFDVEEGAAQISRLLSGSSAERARVAAIAGHFDTEFNRGLLVSLASDSDGDVRAAACALLMKCAADRLDESVRACLRRTARDPGRKVPMQLAFGLPALAKSDSAGASELSKEIRAELLEHPSSRVRLRAQPDWR